MDRAPDPLRALLDRMRAEVGRIDVELAEIALLAQQAASEAERHAARSAQTEERLAGARRDRLDPGELADLNGQLVTLIRRASLMETQVEVLEGKRRALARHRESVASFADALMGVIASSPILGRGALPEDGTLTRLPGGLEGHDGLSSAPTATGPAAGETDGADRARGYELVPAAEDELSGGTTRLVLGAQEDLRREIARAMHDGPAQSLTNIVLEAQIVERLLGRDPEAAIAEMARLRAMVQATLDATKRFIFDVRPMVLDDLGLVPTLRRAARDRGRAVGIQVSFDALGPDRRLANHLESAIFRMLDEALVAYLELRPDRVAMRLDWGDSLDARIATHVVPRLERPGDGIDPGMAPALAALIEERRAATAATRPAIELPASVFNEIRTLAGTIGATAELLEGGTILRVVVSLTDA